ncbi:UNVERIFIED_CONTAM: chromosome-anchoring protein RacA [Paenibacillus phyllosphaerae]
MLKTREVSVQLGVSQTTIRRWITLLPSAPKRDSLGGYLFTAADMDHLRTIQTQIEAGKLLSEITLSPNAGPLPIAPPSAPSSEAPSSPDPSSMDEIAVLELAVTGAGTMTNSLAAETDQLLSRMERLEYALAQKADDIVSIQLLQHRKELEDIRQTVSQLAASIEQLQLPLQMAAAAREKSPVPAPKQQKRRRNIFRLLF